MDRRQFTLAASRLVAAAALCPALPLPRRRRLLVFTKSAGYGPTTQTGHGVRRSLTTR
jgi:hypothetical protein